jgi:uncharacterized protein YdiU (UPF0061 family)
MNTDNMSVLGVTLDYGPYGFLDAYDAGFSSNHTDTEGRYAFDQQPAVGMWNCARPGDALMVLGGSRMPGGKTETYWPAFGEQYQRVMKDKLGLATENADDAGYPSWHPAGRTDRLFGFSAP